MREPLPIAGFREQIIQSVDSQQVTIITAETGAGKSTQVPQYLLEHGYEKVVVTQPRILAARNLSARVREEWLERHPLQPRSVVGYRTAHEHNDIPETALLYCTDGFQLVREVTGEGVMQKQILILDEVHEWNQNMEVLVAWAKKRCLEEAQFKLVIMSATIDAQALATYFDVFSFIEVPGRNYGITMREGGDLVEAITDRLAGVVHNQLVFLPGKAEIEQVATRIRELAVLKDVPVIPLHSQLNAEQQQLAFEHYQNGKIVLATNIAQTSITIDDIDVVVDSGLQRTSEIQNGVEGLIIAEISQADCLQRAGRAGRTKHGEYVLVDFNRMGARPIAQRNKFAVPEILRTHLDRVVLRLASMRIDIEDLPFFHAPPVQTIKQAKKVLYNLGALNDKGEVTEVGYRMERMPVESRYARMLVEALPLSESTRYKLAVIVALQEVGGIARGARFDGWMQYTSETRSDLLAQYDVFSQILDIDVEQFEELGIIEKNVLKARETIERLCQELNLVPVGLQQITPEEGEQLMRCIVAGQVDNLWVMRPDNTARPLVGGAARELSRGRVVTQSGLVCGTPFNLEVSTNRGLNTLFLVQDLTLVKPEWLQELAPQFFTVSSGELTLDVERGCLVRNWHIRYRGEKAQGVATPELRIIPQNRRLLLNLLSRSLYETLRRDRARWQKQSGQRAPDVSLTQVQERLMLILGKHMSVSHLSYSQQNSVRNLANIQTYARALQKKNLVTRPVKRKGR